MTRLIVPALVFGALAGCASTSPRPDAAEVAKLVGERGGRAPPWDREAPFDARVDERVKALVASPLTPDAAVEIALLRSPSLRATYEELGIAQADLVQAGLLPNPGVGVGVGFPIAGSQHLAVQGSVAEDFLGIFLIPLKRRFAKAELARAENLVGHAVQDLDADVRAAYVRYQVAKQLEKLRQTILDAEGASAELARRQFAAGNISELDLASRRALYEDARLASVRAREQVLAARETLNRRMGLWGPETGWKIDEALPALPVADPLMAHVEALAIAKRLDLAAARARTDELGAAWSLASGMRWTASVDLGGTYEQDTEGNHAAGPSLHLELPLFDQHQAELARLSARLRQAEALQAELAVGIRSDVREARTRVIAARAVVEHLRDTVLPLRARVVALSQQQYNGMLLGVYGLVLAKQSEIESWRDYLDAIADYWLARIDLERLVGARLPPSPTSSVPTVPEAR